MADKELQKIAVRILNESYNLSDCPSDWPKTTPKRILNEISKRNEVVRQIARDLIEAIRN